MGTWFQWIADVDATDDEAPRLAEVITSRLAEREILSPDIVQGAAFGDPGYEYGPRWADAVEEAEPWPPGGVRIIATREVFWGGQGEYEWAQCPRCGHRLDPDAHGLLGGVDAWLLASPAPTSCPECRASVELNQWRWHEDYFAFAALGLWFWDWPDLGTIVRDLVRDVAGGHRLVYRAAKL
ncbi:hypothetical protein APR04_000385 [Promicromonospora umidemergens]|uniref:Uncharacterized protein n=1 Tax=Promicromonospora umidemergens TaxID=629679 RepID=A0ABP8X8P2_9MICO|nr:zinc ribbon domain-containing protein [Promicromonospora umidemergens]MCP2281496.1 hypothetical protein [Promicromonospora umidemergens]